MFAFRLTEAERDAIHKAAGPAKASKFVRSLAVAAARNDDAAVEGDPESGQERAEIADASLAADDLSGAPRGRRSLRTKPQPSSRYHLPRPRSS